MKWRWLVVVAMLAISPASVLSQTTENTAFVGVLAHRGAETAQLQWKQLSNYLTDEVEGWNFRIVPVTLISAPDKIESKEIDFLVTNPGHFVTLAEDQPLSALATRERLFASGEAGLLNFGTAVFVRKNSDVSTLAGLKGKTLAAVSPEAFGGFQMAWDEFSRQNINVFEDLETIQFMGFPQDAIVTAVLNGEVDAGVVRSGLLESLDSEGQINIDDILVLSSGSQPDYPFRVTGTLYPEWPFLALSGIEKSLREKVTLALLKTQNSGVKQRYGLSDIWSAPLSYESARQLVFAYQDRTQPLPKNTTDAIGKTAVAMLLGILISIIIGWMIVRLMSRSHPSKNAEHGKVGEGDELAEARLDFETLTRRERQVLFGICTGQTNKKTAEELGISPKTVEFHRANLLKKTDAKSTVHLVQLAARLELDQGFFLDSSSQ